MANQKIHVVTHEKGWAVRKGGNSDVDSVHTTQKEAIDAAKALAKEQEADLVVHRADGTFRNVISFSDIGNGDAREEESQGTPRRRLEPEDVLSVGSRVSWSAILGGAAIALAVLMALGTLGLALGLTTRESLSQRTTYIAAVAWTTVTALVALFVGGFVTSRVTAGETPAEAITYGFILWAVLFALASAAGTAGVNTGLQALAVARQEDPRPVLPDNVTVPRASEQPADPIDAKEAAWWAFAGIIVSMLAAVAGTTVGAGPRLTLIRRRRFGTPVSAEGTGLAKVPA